MRTRKQRINNLVRGLFDGNLSGDALNAQPFIDVSPDDIELLLGDESDDAEGGLATWYDESAVVASAGPQTYTLTYTPVEESLFVRLRGVMMDPAVDYSVDWVTGVVTITDSLVVDDTVDFRYQTKGDVTNAVQDTGGIAPAFVCSLNDGNYYASTDSGNPTLVDFSACAPSLVDGDLILVCVNTPSGSDVLDLPAGWSRVDAPPTGYTNLTVFYKISDGTETDFPLSDSEGTNCAVTVAIYSLCDVVNTASASEGVNSTTWDQPQVAVTTAPATIVHFTATQDAFVSDPITDLGSGVTVREFGADQGTVRTALGDFTATSAGTSPLKTATKGGGSQSWAGITLELEAM